MELLFNSFEDQVIICCFCFLLLCFFHQATTCILVYTFLDFSQNLFVFFEDTKQYSPRVRFMLHGHLVHLSINTTLRMTEANLEKYPEV